MRIKVEGEPKLVRDMGSGTIINHDDGARQLYLNNRKRAMNEKERMKEIVETVNDLKTEMNEMRSSIRDILSLLRGNDK